MTVPGILVRDFPGNRCLMSVPGQGGGSEYKASSADDNAVMGVDSQC